MAKSSEKVGLFIMLELFPDLLQLSENPAPALDIPVLLVGDSDVLDIPV